MISSTKSRAIVDTPLEQFLFDRLHQIDEGIAALRTRLNSLLRERLDILVAISICSPKDLAPCTNTVVDDDAWTMLEFMRWPDGPRCPNCDDGEAYRHRSRRLFSCKSCHGQFTITQGTLFSSHKLGPRAMLLTILALRTDPSLKAVSLMRLLEVQYVTAHKIVRKARRLRSTDPFLNHMPLDDSSGSQCQRSVLEKERDGRRTSLVE